MYVCCVSANARLEGKSVAAGLGLEGQQIANSNAQFVFIFRVHARPGRRHGFGEHPPAPEERRISTATVKRVVDPQWKGRS